MSSRDIMTKSHGSRGLPWLTALLAAAATALWAVLGPAPDFLVFDRTAIANGEIWRLITGHLVHSDTGHALWNISALVVLGLLMEPRGRLHMVTAAGIGMLAVSSGLWWYMPELERYCGLSGMLNTLFVVLLADLWRCHRHPVFVVVAFALTGKLLAEMLTQQSLVITTAWPTVPLSHLAGCIGGLAYAKARNVFRLTLARKCKRGDIPVWRKDHVSGRSRTSAMGRLPLFVGNEADVR